MIAEESNASATFQHHSAFRPRLVSHQLLSHGLDRFAIRRPVWHQSGGGVDVRLNLDDKIGGDISLT